MDEETLTAKPASRSSVPQVQRTWATRARRRPIISSPGSENLGHPTTAANGAICLLCSAWVAVAGCTGQVRRSDQKDTSVAAKPAQGKAPFYDARSQPAEYAGPGRDTPPPENIDEVRIGWFGPDDPSHPTAGMMWQAAALAVEDANQAGGYRGLPFRLVTSWSENPWGTGIGGVTRLVYEQRVWVIAGGPDGPSAHLVEQVVAKARLAFVSCVSTDKTANLANVPWIFSCAPGDHLQAPVLAQALVSQRGAGHFAIVSCTDHDSRLFTTELLTALNTLKAFPNDHLEFRPGLDDFSRQLQSIRRARPAALALIAGPADAARFLTALRREGLTVPVFGGPMMGRRKFIEAAGQSAEGVLFPLLWHRSAAGERSVTFARRFEERFGIVPDYTAAFTYDALNLLIAAVRQAGLNRVRIRDAVRRLSPWPGVSGTITWDPTGQNHRPVRLGTVQNGQTTVVESRGPKEERQGRVLHRHRRGERPGQPHWDPGGHG